MTDTAPTRQLTPAHVFAFGVFIAGLLTLGSFAPLANAWWYRDDFWMLTLSRYVDNPLLFWNSDHSASFFYRPFGMTLWWVTTQLFGADVLPARAAVMSVQGATPVDASLLGFIPNGLPAFFNSLPLALTGQFDANSALGRAMPFLALFVFVLICVRAIFSKTENGLSRRTLALAITLVATAALLHAPIAAQNLYGAALLNDPITARLFHMTLAGGFLLLLAPCMHIFQGIRIRQEWWMLVAASVALATATHSFRLAQTWSSMTSGELRPLLAQTIKQIDRATLTDNCRIVVHGPLAQQPDFQRLSDIMVKALARNSSGQLLHCVIVAVDQVPTFAIVAKELCEGNAVQQLAILHPSAKPRPFGNLCYQFLVLPFLSNSQTKSLDVDIR